MLGRAAVLVAHHSRQSGSCYCPNFRLQGTRAQTMEISGCSCVEAEVEVDMQARKTMSKSVSKYCTWTMKWKCISGEYMYVCWGAYKGAGFLPHKRQQKPLHRYQNLCAKMFWCARVYLIQLRREVWSKHQKTHEQMEKRAAEKIMDLLPTPTYLPIGDFIGQHLSTQYLHSIYTVSTQYRHSIYTVSTQYRHSIYTVSTQYRHSIYTVSIQYRHSIDTVSTQYIHSIYTVSTQ